MPDIQAQTPDGVIHSFPAGTPDAIVDKAIKDYLSTPKMATGSFQSRPGGPIMNSSVLPGGANAPTGQKESFLKRVGRGAALGSAQGAGIPETQSPVTDLVKGMLQRPSPLGILDPTGGALSGAYGMVQNAVAAGKDVYKGFQSGDPEQMAHGVGSGVVQALMLKGLTNLKPETTGQGLKAGAHQIVGAGEAAEGVAAKSVAENNAAAMSTYQGKVGDILSKNQEAISQARQDRAAQIASIQHDNEVANQTYQSKLAQVRQVNEQTKAAVSQGVESEKVAQAMTGTISSAMPDFADAMTKQAKAAYPDIAGTVDRGAINKAMSKVVDDKLYGSGSVPTSMAKILDDTKGTEGKSTGPRIGGRHLDLSAPDDLRSYQQLKVQGAFSPSEIERIEGGAGKPLTHDDLHGMYSEMGRELYGRDLPGDSKAALAAGRKIVLDQMENLATADKKLTQFKAAQRGWQVLENTFYNSDPTIRGGSPIARALNARDPITGQLRPDYVRQILTENKSYRVAQQLLGNYKATDLQSSLQLLKEHADLAKASPKIAKLKPEPAPPIPQQIPPMRDINLRNLPKPVQKEVFNAMKWRETKIENYAVEGQKLRPRDFMHWRLPFTAIQQLLSKVLTNPKARAAILK